MRAATPDDPGKTKLCECQPDAVVAPRTNRTDRKEVEEEAKPTIKPTSKSSNNCNEQIEVGSKKYDRKGDLWGVHRLWKARGNTQIEERLMDSGGVWIYSTAKPKEADAPTRYSPRKFAKWERGSCKLADISDKATWTDIDKMPNKRLMKETPFVPHPNVTCTNDCTNDCTKSVLNSKCISWKKTDVKGLKGKSCSNTNLVGNVEGTSKVEIFKVKVNT